MEDAVLRWLIAGGILIVALLTPFVVAILPLDRSWRRVDWLLSLCGTIVRGGAGSRACFKRKSLEPAPKGSKQKKKEKEPLLVLYEYETCPFCRLVRETLTDLELDFEMRPCPMPSMKLSVAEGVKQGLSRYRPDLTRLGDKMQARRCVPPHKPHCAARPLSLTDDALPFFAGAVSN
jgi:hypothetical protein